MVFGRIDNNLRFVTKYNFTCQECKVLFVVLFMFNNIMHILLAKQYTCPYIFIIVLGPRGKTYWSQRQIVFFLWKQEVPNWLCSCRWLPVFWVWITPKHSHFPRRIQKRTRIANTPLEYWGRIEIFHWHSWSRQWRSICNRSKIRDRHFKRTLKVN